MKKYNKNMDLFKFIKTPDSKFFIISTILLVSVYFLYFYDVNSPKAEIEDVENFDGRYKNLCVDTKTNVYNMNLSNLSGNPSNNIFQYDTSDCMAKCISHDCHAYLINEVSGNPYNCYLYKGTLDASGNDPNLDVSINCQSRILPEDLGYVYNGYGYVNTNYFRDNKDNFKHIDAGLKYGNVLNNKFKYLDTTYNNIKKYNNYSALGLVPIISSINDWLQDAACFFKIDYNSLKSRIDVDIFDTHVDVNRDSSNNIFLKNTYKSSAKNKSLDANEESTMKRYNTNYLIYIILAFIMVISIILLIIYKFVPDIISDSLMISYFVGIVCLLAFLQYFLKI